MSVLEPQANSGKPKPASYGVERLNYGLDQFQFGDLRLPEGNAAHPVAIVIHGGFWKAGYGLDLMDNLANDLKDHRIATWNIEYRRVGYDGLPGNPGGGWPGTLTDVANAADYLRELAPRYNLDLERVVTLGHSAGGQLALWLAGRSHLPATAAVTTSPNPLPLTAAVSLAGVADMEMMWEVRQNNSPVANFLGGRPDEVPERYALSSPRQLLPLGLPQILVHGDQDKNVPVELSRHYYELATAAGDNVTYLELAGVEHFAVIDPNSAAWTATLKELLPLLNL